MSSEVDDAPVEALVRAGLERPDAVMKSGGRVWLPPADSRSETWYTIRGYQGWQLPGGAEIECLGLEDREARRRRNQELISETGERPNLTEPYRGLLLGLRRSGDGQAPRVVRRPLRPEAMFGELIRISKPLQDPEHGWVVTVEHSALVFESTFTRKMRLETVFSLATLRQVAQREVSEVRYHHDTGDVVQLRDGQKIGVQEYDRESAPDLRSFKAAGVIVDERGEPVQGVRVSTLWKRRIKVSMLESKSRYYKELHKTDAHGRFSQEITGGATTCSAYVYHPGYLLMHFQFRAGEGERTIQLVPLPEFTVGASDILYGVLRTGRRPGMYAIGRLLEDRGVGLVIGRVGDDRAARWTKNRDEADLWFEVVDERLEDKVQTAVAPEFRGRIKDWEMEIHGLGGTEFVPILDPPREGMPDALHYMEAPDEGYGTYSRGLAPLPRGYRNEQERVTKLTLPTAFFVRKNGRYGRIEDLRFDLREHLVGDSYWDREAKVWRGERSFDWEVQVGTVVMQALPLGHRFLIHKEVLEEVPSWVE